MTFFFVQLTSALFCHLRKANQFMGSVSQPIIAAAEQLCVYPPFLGVLYISNFIHPVYRLSKAPVSDETPFAGESPNITASQASRQLSQLCRLVASDHQLRLLGRNRSLVASDRQLQDFRDGFGCHSPDDRLFLRWGAGVPQSLVDSLSSLPRELVDARRFSSDLQGANRPPFTATWGFVSSATIRCCCCWSICVLATTIRLRI